MPSKSQVEIIRNSTLLEYKPDALYKQMAYATQAVRTCTVALTGMMDDIILTQEEDNLGKALAARAEAVATEINDILRQCLHLKSSRSDLQKLILTNTCEATRVTMSWFQKFMDEHSESQLEVLKPIAEEAEILLKELDGLRKLKVEEARKMEEAHEKEIRRNRKQAKVNKHQTMNPPFDDPVDIPIEDTGLDIRALIEQASQDISDKENE